MIATELEDLYADYLRSNLDRGAALALGNALRAHGLLDEGNLLLAYLEHGPNAVFTLKNRAWRDNDCYAGQLPPQDAVAGDLWFDVVEMSLMMLVPATGAVSPDMMFWISTHPVYVWQFRAFLRLVQWQLSPRYYVRTNLLQPERFDRMNSLSWVTDLYHEEACAYAVWFSKSITSQFNLESAEQYMTDEQFGCVLPPQMRLWHRGYSGYDYLRIAVGGEHIHTNPWQDIGRLDDMLAFDSSATLESLPNRLMYGEWERHADIGFATKAAYGSLTRVSLPGLAHDFIELRNLAPRPALYPLPEWRRVLGDILRTLGL